MSDSKTRIFLVDDDALYLNLLKNDFLAQTDYIIETYATGELCVENLSRKPDIIILDYFLDGIEKTAINGIEALDRIKLYDPNIPVVMLSCQDQIEVAVNCMHHKAHDYVVKSETAFMRLQKIITDIVDYNKIAKELTWYMDRM
ncbi:MAG: response regulator [Bacteroidetes bacterium]|nr:response regulator [Bacteroidota bacterium]